MQLQILARGGGDELDYLPDRDAVGAELDLAPVPGLGVEDGCGCSAPDILGVDVNVTEFRWVGRVPLQHLESVVILCRYSSEIQELFRVYSFLNVALQVIPHAETSHRGDKIAPETTYDACGGHVRELE